MTIDARNAAREIFLAGVAAAQAPRLLRPHLEALKPERETVGKLFVLAAGKAAAFMAREAEEILGNRITAGHAVTKHGHGCALKHISLTEAGHPTPDANSFKAAARIADLAQSAGEGDLVLCLFSGGASALLADGPPQATVADMMALHESLVRCGASIHEINAVRKHLSRIKGGQLARQAQPARVRGYLLSDVIGDPLDVIASGPTAPDSSTFADALQAVEKYNLQSRIPTELIRHLREGAEGLQPETPKPGDSLFIQVTNCVIGNNRIALEACQKKAAELGLDARIVNDSLNGGATTAARGIISDAAQERRHRCLLYGGETTVGVAGNGLGGRCQHFALAAAQELASQPGLTLLAAGTDGSDGPTDAAGAVVDAQSVPQARSLGLDAADFLRRFDSWHFFAQAGGHVKTGPTQTNVMDIVVVIISKTYA